MQGAEDENDIETEAAEFLVDKVNSHPDQITILALGHLQIYMLLIKLILNSFRSLMELY